MQSEWEQPEAEIRQLVQVAQQEEQRQVEAAVVQEFYSVPMEE